MTFTKEQIFSIVQEQGMNLLHGIIVLAVGFFLAHWIIKLMERSRKLVRIEPTLKGFLENLLRLLLYVSVVLTAAGVMGIPLTSFVTILASAGVAISLAMQGALSNFVGGMTMLLLKPIKVDEYVKIGEIEGTVRSIGVFYTELVMPDNRHISLPNANLTNTAIVNYTREGTRRLDVFFSVGYSSDIDRVKAALLGVARRNEAAFSDPAPQVRLQEHGDSALKFVVRLWCKNSDYWELYYYLLEEGKRALDRAGIEIPFPQMDVHLR